MTDTNDLELFHHGVKGMKWGVRKRRDGGDGSSISTRHFKKFEKSIREARAKDGDDSGYTKRELDNIHRSNQKREQFDKSRAQYKKNTSRGKTFAQYALGGVATYGYRSARGSGASRGEALVASFLTGPAAGVAYREIRINTSR